MYGPQVQRLLAARRRHPWLVDGDQLPQRLDEHLFGQLRDRQPARRGAQPPGIGLRPERDDGAVRPAIGLEPLEHLLGVVQHDGRRVQFDRPVRDHPRVVPALSLEIVDRHHVVGVELAERRIVQNRRPYLVAHRLRVALNRELKGAVSHAAIVYPLATGFLPRRTAA